MSGIHAEGFFFTVRDFSAVLLIIILYSKPDTHNIYHINAFIIPTKTTHIDTLRIIHCSNCTYLLLRNKLHRPTIAYCGIFIYSHTNLECQYNTHVRRVVSTNVPLLDCNEACTPSGLTTCSLFIQGCSISFPLSQTWLSVRWYCTHPLPT